MEKQVEINLDFRNKRSISDQLQSEMRRLIEEGIFVPGDQLPTVRSLAAQLQVNFNTVARVYRVLDQEGLIFTLQGRGSYISKGLEGSAPPKLLTHKEQIEQLITDLFEKAERKNISTKELQAALLQRIQRHKRVAIRKRHPSQKKRFTTPAWFREVRNANSMSATTEPPRRLKRRRR